MSARTGSIGDAFERQLFATLTGTGKLDQITGTTLEQLITVGAAAGATAGYAEVLPGAPQRRGKPVR
jgi:hypothetical protein